MFGKDGFLVAIYAVQQQKKITSGDLGLSAWYAQPALHIFKGGN